MKDESKYKTSKSFDTRNKTFVNYSSKTILTLNKHNYCQLINPNAINMHSTIAQISNPFKNPNYNQSNNNLNCVYDKNCHGIFQQKYFVSLRKYNLFSSYILP